MDSINTAMQKAFWDTDIPDFPPIAFEQGYEMGANYVLEQIMKILPNEDRLLNDAGKALLWRLNDCVEQLKNK